MFKLPKLGADLRLLSSARQGPSTSISRLSNVLLGAAFSLVMLSGSWHGAAAAPGPIVTTQEGRVQGLITNDGVAEFLGLPYAAPPVGPLRWKPTKKHEPWTNVLSATAYGPTCAQITEFAVFAGPANNNDDCLYLNVFTPNLNDKAKLPVILWIHGGGNINGESNDYDGSKLASQGHTVVVTINYRLGLLGFFAQPALDEEGHHFANYGTLDQQAALKWVKRNASRLAVTKTT